MKITIFGLTLSSSWGNGHATPYRAILRALHRRGVRVSSYEKNVSYYAKHRDLDFFCNYCNLRFCTKLLIYCEEAGRGKRVRAEATA